MKTIVRTEHSRNLPTVTIYKDPVKRDQAEGVAVLFDFKETVEIRGGFEIQKWTVFFQKRISSQIG